jgi:hypothetical protein
MYFSPIKPNLEKKLKKNHFWRFAPKKTEKVGFSPQKFIARPYSSIKLAVDLIESCLMGLFLLINIQGFQKWH